MILWVASRSYIISKENLKGIIIWLIMYLAVIGIRQYSESGIIL